MHGGHFSARNVRDSGIWMEVGSLERESEAQDAESEQAMGGGSSSECERSEVLVPGESQSGRLSRFRAATAFQVGIWGLGAG